MSKRQHVHQLLRNAGPRGVTTAELIEAVGPRYGPRLLELRDAGHVIETCRLRASSYRYTLQAPEPVAPDVAADVSGRRAATVRARGPHTPAAAEPEPLFVLAPAPPLNASLHDAEAA